MSTPHHQPGQIKREREVLVFANRFGELYNDDVVSPNGTHGQYLRWRWSTRGVLAVPVLDNTIAFVPAFRYPVGDVFLELPRGAVEPGEPVVDAARRELREEAGITATAGVVLGVIFADTGLIESGVSVVLARVAARENPGARPDDMESFAAPRWLRRSQTHEAISSGLIRCGLSLAALALVWSCAADVHDTT